MSLVCLALAAAVVFAQPYQCTRGQPNFLNCNPCQAAPTAVDFLFLIDVSPSMQQYIDAVHAGLDTMVSEITTNMINARYAITEIASENEMVMDWTDSSMFAIQQFAQMKAGSQVPNFQASKGGQESTFEAIRQVLGVAPESQLEFDHVVNWQPMATGYVNWRPGATKFILLLTDEDSDRPWLTANQFPNEVGTGPNQREPPTLSQWQYHAAGGGWGLELDDAANALINNNVVLFVFSKDNWSFPKQMGPSMCDTVSGTLFDANGTLNCLVQNGVDQGVQGQMLAAGKIARVFPIVSVTDPGYIDNFFKTAVATVSNCASKRSVEQSQSACSTTSCDVNKGCLITYTCAAGCMGVCNIGGTCYVRGAVNPANGCQYCEPTQSATSWHTCGVDPVVSVTGDQCASEQCTNNVCMATRKCLPQCQCCCIGGSPAAMSGVCDGNVTAAGLDVNGVDHGSCSICSPLNDFYHFWTDPSCMGTTSSLPPLPPLTTAPPGAVTMASDPLCASVVCNNGGKCFGGACNCAGTGFTGQFCDQIPLSCSPPCLNSGQCMSGNVCNCANTGFTGPQCNSAITTANPFIGQTGNGPFLCTDSAKATCTLQCPTGLAQCVCDMNGNAIGRMCMAPGTAPVPGVAPGSTTMMGVNNMNMKTVIGGLSAAQLGGIIGGTVGGCLLLAVIGFVVWRMLPNAQSSLRYSSRRGDSSFGGGTMKMKETDVL